jgi:deaminated glutathione amidase
MSKAATFTAGLVQMRSGLSPHANLDAAVRLIEEAKRAGADYVLTPEMTNILEIKRERLFGAMPRSPRSASLPASSAFSFTSAHWRSSCRPKGRRTAPF